MIPRRQFGSYPELPPSAMRLLRAIPSPDLGRLASTVLPGLAIGDVGQHSLVLLRGISRVLVEREQAA